MSGPPGFFSNSWVRTPTRRFAAFSHRMKSRDDPQVEIHHTCIPKGFSILVKWDNHQSLPPVHTQQVEQPRRKEVPPQAMQEVKLFGSSREREKLDNLADLFSIIKTTEHLEKAYVRDSISSDEYTEICTKLIDQFATSKNLVKESISSVEDFMKSYRLDCPAAKSRLIEFGVPQTVLSRKISKKSDAVTVGQTVQHFITAMDSLKLNLTAIDEIHPLLTDLLDALNKNIGLPPKFEGREKLQNWLILMNKMKAHEDLGEDQIRQLLFDLESSYNAFFKEIDSSKD